MIRDKNYLEKHGSAQRRTVVSLELPLCIRRRLESAAHTYGTDISRIVEGLTDTYIEHFDMGQWLAGRRVHETV